MAGGGKCSTTLYQKSALGPSKMASKHSKTVGTFLNDWTENRKVSSFWFGNISYIFNTAASMVNPILASFNDH